ncbi:hypothetical protein [Prevotella sp. S7-1-8]|jgi:hypothetical protein|uniref:hypothetical protein n=1 Tax=Prevotella sp. S7-1-8 TaxID=1284775 RepID=UPI001E55A38A|nr:hypothetical protein [Prevotella sp. S7-1-8]
MKKRKMTTMLIKVLRHDFGFYNSVFKWDALPSPIDSSFEYLLPILELWEVQGFIRLFKIDDEQMIEVLKPLSMKQITHIKKDLSKE